MADRITKSEEEQIIALYVQYGSYNKVAKEMKRSINTIKKIVESNEDKCNLMKTKQNELIKTSEEIIEERLIFVDEIFDLSLKSLKEIVSDPRAYAKDKIEVFRAIKDFKYQVKNLELKEREIKVKEALADKIINTGEGLDSNIVTIIDDMPKGDSNA